MISVILGGKSGFYHYVIALVFIYLFNTKRLPNLAWDAEFEAWYNEKWACLFVKVLVIIKVSGLLITHSRCTF